MNFLKYSFPSFLLLSLMCSLASENKFLFVANNKSFTNYSLQRIIDTIYTLSNNYIHIDLQKQTAFLYQKNDSTLSFKISSGNPNISKGIETPSGIFTVQSKSPLAISKQFNNAKLFNWIGFNGNVGFHGLEGKSYYSHLGKRSSSHGCVRISLEDGALIYKKVKLGTPVIVTNNQPARVIAFIDSNEIDYKNTIFIDNSKYVKSTLNMKLKSLYKGNYFTDNFEKFIFNYNVLKSWSIDIGDVSKVPLRQKEPITFLLYSFLQDNMKYSFINKIQ